jgi:putative thioredoxin
MSGPNVIDVTDATFQRDVIEKSRDIPVVVDFWAPWCGPCRTLGPVLERLANEDESNFILAKMNVDHNQVYACQFQVQGIPAVKAFKDGKMVSGFVGAQPEPNVRRFLSQLGPASKNGKGDETNDLLKAGKFAEAARLMEAKLAENPGQPALRLKLAKTLLRAGQGCQAQTQLEDFPVSPEYDDAQRLLALAAYLCDMSKVQANGSELDNLYIKAASQLANREYGAGLYNLLSVIRHDKYYRDGQAKDVMLGVFALLGESDDMTRSYRSQLASALW